jgi:UDP-N-acetylglucosamine 1-carboxyvinyltransferase
LGTSTRERSRDEVFVIEGGRELTGRICISGSKNAALPLMAASLLTSEEVTLRNLPMVADTALMREILAGLGARTRAGTDGTLTLAAADVSSSDVPDDLGRRMRASFVLLGPLLARAGKARVPRPGGDEIGARRVEQHVRGLRQMGAEIDEREGDFVATIPGRLQGARVVFDLPTVTGTENILMAAVLAEGRTDILNAAREPHVQDLARLLNSMGARVYGAGTDEIVVEGVKRLGGAEHAVIPDYLEAGTYAIAVAATGGELVLECSPPSDLAAVLLKLQNAGVEVEAGEDWFRVARPAGHPPSAVDMATWVHPGFPTDLQAQYVSLMTQAEGTAVISEYLYENRFQHLPELRRMGARIEVEGRTAVIHGPTPLRGEEVVVPDIRSGAALVIAALCARGTTRLRHAWHVDRGYQDIVGKLSDVGAAISRRSEELDRPPAHRGYE